MSNLVSAIMYLWCLRMGAKWTQKAMIGWPLYVTYILVAFVVALLCGRFLRTASVAVGLNELWAPYILSFVFQFAVGSIFFGKFAILPGGGEIGLINGMKITAIGLGLLILIGG